MLTLDKDKGLVEKGIAFTRKSYIYGHAKIEAPARLEGVVIGGCDYIGGFTYIASGGIIKGCKSIGRFCSIANDVSIGYGNHDVNMISTHPIFVGESDIIWENYSHLDNDWIKDNQEKSKTNMCKKNEASTIGNDVWIGKDVFICNGCHVGNGAVIGAKSVVTKDIPPYAIVAGSPAKIIRFRFNIEQIGKLEEIKWWDYGPNILNGLNLYDVDKVIKEVKLRIDNGARKQKYPSVYFDGVNNIIE